MAELTHDALCRRLNYDPETGVFTWKSVPQKKYLGQPAGTLMAHGYIAICLFGKKYLAHRLAWLYANGSWPRHEIDHVNRVRNDNRISNLREADESQNSANSSMRRHNTSGVTGVWWRATRRRWVAEIQCRGRGLYIGSFRDIEAAKAAYVAAARIHFGEFAPVESPVGATL